MLFYLCEANDPVGIIIGNNANRHLTIKSNLCSSFGVLQFDGEVFHILWEVIINYIYRDVHPL